MQQSVSLASPSSDCEIGQSLKNNSLAKSRPADGNFLPYEYYIQFSAFLKFTQPLHLFLDKIHETKTVFQRYNWENVTVLSPFDPFTFYSLKKWLLLLSFSWKLLFQVCRSSNREPTVKLLSSVRLFVTPWTVAYQAPPSMEFSRPEYWSGLPFPSPEDLPYPGIEPGSPTLQADTLPSEPPRNQNPAHKVLFSPCLFWLFFFKSKIINTIN